jgi:hypothetical protein
MFKLGELKALEKLLAPLLPHASILMHLKICNKHADFANSDLLQYTLVPQLNDCSDFYFLKNTEFQKEAGQVLSNLAKCFNSVFYQLTSNFFKFALLFGGYDCVKAASQWDDNLLAIEQGIEASEICIDATEEIMENLDNFLWPSIFTFL